MFVDKVKLDLRAGKGGNGIVAWRREKYIPKGGPCGGDGGTGGSVIIEASHDVYALDKYRNINVINADNGGQGGPNNRHGRDGKDRIIKVPCGTLILNPEDGSVLHDLLEDKQRIILCEGGRGGKGNTTFKTSTNRAPQKCTSGKPGQNCTVELELKMIADIGFVGMPNAGKSTLLSTLTTHAVKIGDYPFTTLVPNLGYIEFDDYKRLTFADIPGLIEGASHNRGLGYAFLKHVERTKALLFVLDAADPVTHPIRAFEILHKELSSYSQKLASKDFLICLNKADEELAEEQIAAFRAKFPYLQTVAISAKHSQNMDAFTDCIRSLVPPSYH